MEELVERVRAAVAQQPFMTTLGITVAHAAEGEADLALPFDERFTQHGFLHAGAVAAALDSACGYAAWAAAVLRRGGRLTVCRGEAYADERLVATRTTMAVRNR